ncbi:MAG: ATP-binding protein [Flavobacteriaceae bacterium]|nr:ATP-binding protein [Flavobacteriaceae bacterium]
MIDRGKAQYFHGREREKSVFRKMLNIAKKSMSGTIFLIQGSPGVGKTALLEEFKEMAIVDHWGVVKIKPDGLWDTEQLKKYLKREWKIKLKDFKGKASAYGVQVEANFEFSKKSVLQILESSKNPLLLVLDEAQNIKKVFNTDFTTRNTVENVLDEIHNGGFDRPLMFAVSGLGMTKNILQELGISRFNQDCAINLGKIDQLSERKIIRDWIYQAGNIDKNINVDLWIHEITKETCGWAQHINAYGRSASEYLRTKTREFDQGCLTRLGLDNVLEEGKRKRLEYYKERVISFHYEEIEEITKMLNEKTILYPMKRRDIICSFKKEFPTEKSEDLFERVVEKGVFHRIDDGRYIVPVPSMKHWLMSHQWNIKEEKNGPL